MSELFNALFLSCCILFRFLCLIGNIYLHVILFYLYGFYLSIEDIYSIFFSIEEIGNVNSPESAIFCHCGRVIDPLGVHIGF